MYRFYVFIAFKGSILEECVGEGIEFSNESIALFEYSTDTILMLKSIKALKNHYKPLGKVKIEWLDLDLDEKIIN
jgi:hypothetical protein